VPQTFAFRHFNLHLHSLQEPTPSSAFQAHSVDVSSFLPLAVQSAVLLNTPLDQLDESIQHVLYTQTMPAIVHELEQFRVQNWKSQEPLYPLLMVILEHLIGFYKAGSSSPAFAANGTANGATHGDSDKIHPSLAGAASTIASKTQAVIISLCGSLAQLRKHSSGEISQCLLGGLFALLQCEQVAKHVSFGQWLHALESLKSVASVHPQVRSVLGDAMVFLSRSPSSSAPENLSAFCAAFQTHMLFLLTPTVGFSSDIAFHSFWRLSSTAPASWSARLKDWIPPAVHPDLVRFVKAIPEWRRKEEKATRRWNSGVERTNMMTVGPTAGGSVAVPDDLAKLKADAEKLRLDSEQYDAGLAAHAANPIVAQQKQQMVQTMRSAAGFVHAVVQETAAAMQL
jgi:hypothetical protein